MLLYLDVLAWWAWKRLLEMPVHLESRYLILLDVQLSSAGVRSGWVLGRVKLGFMLRLVDRDCRVDRCIRYAADFNMSP